MNVRLLGPLEVHLEDGPIELGPRKQRAVLAMLALEPGRAVSADHLAEGLWGDEPPPSGAKMVQLYVSHLRRVLGDDGVRIVTRDHGYELQLAGAETDVQRFEHLLGESRAREALALWRGAPLADLAGEPFAAAEIRRLDELRLRASEAAIDADLEAGRHVEVIGELEALVAEQPLREHLHAQRMLALYRSGRQSEALEAYREARAGLVDEIGVEPGAELRQLQDAILAQEPALELPAAAEAEPTTAPRPPPRRRVLLAGAAAMLIAGVTAFGVIRVLEPDGLPGIDENAVGLIDADSGRITDQYRVGKSPGAVTSGAGSVWVANRADGTLSRIDRDRQIATIDVGGAPSGLAFGAGSVWVADGDARHVVQVDPGRNKVVQHIPVGNAPRSLAVAGGALWVASGVEGNVDRIELADVRNRGRIPVGAIPTALVAGQGGLWIASEESNTVTRLDARTGRIVRVIPVGNGPGALAAGEGAVWVANRHDGTVSRIDPARNIVSGLIPTGGDPTALAAGGGSVWVAKGGKGAVARVDPTRLEEVEQIPTDSSPAGVALADGSLWTTAVASQSSHRGGTLRALFYGWGRFPIDPLDKDGYYVVTWQASSLVYDGLVAYRRVGGSAPGLVGALATNAPEPSRDGRTYVFTLRPGVRYSDGRLVEPEDFRASMERLLRIGPPESFPSYYDGIVGARRCDAGRCDLSRGIATDRAARTITVHLSRPDGDFLHKLTMPFAFVMPAGTPMRSTRNHPPPGTGPYRVASWDDKRGGALVRNPRFRSWSPEARPAGFADRIEVRHEQRPIKAQIADVDGGRADLVPIGDLFDSHLSRQDLAALAARAPGQLASGPQPTTEWMFLNVRQRPFDDPGVRRALNLATDRARIVELVGGPEVAVATCQMVPTAFPGHQPYCPYTVDPKDGGWVGPDMERARALVKASGRAGERVVVRAPRFRAAVGRYFAGLLDELGFRASLKVEGLETYFGSMQDPRSRAQIGFVGWSMDFESPSQLLRLHFSCPRRSSTLEQNTSRICDRRLTGQIRRASAAPIAQSARAWAAVDRRATDLAVTVPLTNHRAVVLVSKRAGNVQHHLQWFTLLDQMWVR